MDRRRSAVKKKSKAKKTPQKKEIKIVPRLRLEPRLTPKLEPDVKKRRISNDEVKEISFTEQNGTDNSCHKVPFEDGPIVEIEEQINNVLFPMNTEINEGIGTSNEGQLRDALYRMRTAMADESDSFGINGETGVNNLIRRMKSRCKRGVKGTRCWADREIMSLATGLQSHGFSELDKVAEMVETRTEAEIRQFVKCRAAEACKMWRTERLTEKQKRGRPVNIWWCVGRENLSSWPNIRKWRRMAFDQILNSIRSRDYSKPVISSLCEKFYEEEEEPTDPQVINVKAIYRYLMDCVKGDIPAQLPPKESAMVLSLLNEMRSLPSTYDFEEEKKFLQEYKEATKFKPFHIKDEFKKRFNKDTADNGGQTVSVPESVFMELSRHKRIVQSFNPLVTPVWMMQKEQELLGKYNDRKAHVD